MFRCVETQIDFQYCSFGIKVSRFRSHVISGSGCRRRKSSFPEKIKAQRDTDRTAARGGAAEHR
jgi:hypothetical protein